MGGFSLGTGGVRSPDVFEYSKEKFKNGLRTVRYCYKDF